jgi:CRP-like cAMP-binding protein
VVAPQNQVLSALSKQDFARLKPSLLRVPLVQREVLEESEQQPSHIYFPVAGIVSVVAGPSDLAIEVGIIGRDGMTGAWAIVGHDTSPCTCFVQVAGEAWRISFADLSAAMEHAPAIRQACLVAVGRLMAQTAETAWSNGRSSLSERLARWLMLCQDRIDGDTIPMTHEFLSIMLGVRRPGVTIALQTLEGAGVIRNTRGVVVIRNRRLLQQVAARANGRDGQGTDERG